MKSDTQSPLLIPADFNVFAIRFERSFNSFQVTTSSSHISAIASGILAALSSTSNEKEATWSGRGGVVVTAANKTFRSPRKLVIAPIVVVFPRNFQRVFKAVDDNGCGKDGTSGANNILEVVY